MYIQQLYTSCLAEATYYIESNGEAAIIDPLRDVNAYLELAASRKAQIKYVFETHFHADFVSGHQDLAEKTGAVIVYGPTTMKTGFKMLVAKDGDLFRLGDVQFQLIHTPGHTMESSCFLLRNEAQKEVALFTGDTLFIGDVGRPDLAQHVIAELTEEKLAGYLFHSLREKIMPLSDDLIIYPGHGAGSACGKNMSKETFDTLGHQKKLNYALDLNLTKEQFIKVVLSGLTPPPGYFPQNVLLNINGYDSIDVVMQRGIKPLDAQTFNTLSKTSQALILDSRQAEDFEKGFIPGSINIGLNGSFAVWAGTLIEDVKQPLLLVCDEGKETEVVSRLARVGYDNALGFLKGGINSWRNAGSPLHTISSVTSEQLVSEIEKHHVEIIDVRKTSEFNNEHLISAISEPLDYIHSSERVLDTNKMYYVYCAGGYRSMTYISILRNLGYNNLINVKGGISSLKEHPKLKFSNTIQQKSLI